MRLRIGEVGSSLERPVIQGWHRIRSPGSRLGYLLAGLAGLAFPALLIVWLSVVSLVTQPGAGAQTPVETSTPWGAVLLALLLFIPLHELAHAIWHPQHGLSPRTVVVVWPTKLRFGVYYEGCMARRQWLLMRVAPLLLLSILPAGLLTLFQWVAASYPLHVFLQVLLLVNGIGSGGDVIAVMWVLGQVPRGADICFSDGKAYWR